MKVLVTGANGFVGRGLLVGLRRDMRVVPIALVRDQMSDVVDGVEIRVSGALEAQEPCTGILDGIDVIVHLAARAHMLDEPDADPLETFRRVNVEGTLRLAHQAAEAGVRRFVFVSSIGVNGNQTTSPFSESDMPHPHDAYTLSKYEAERGLLDISDQTGMEVVIIRPPLVYGANAPGNFGSLVTWVRKGVPLPLGAVRNQRSLVALDNLVDFIALCADRERSPKAANEVFLISDGEDVSTSELLRKVAKAYGVRASLLPVPVGLMSFLARILGKGAVADRLFGSLQVDNSKARKLLGWRPVVTMDEALRRMVDCNG